MRQILAALFLYASAATPVAAQDDPPAPEMGEGLDLMEEGARILLRGLLSEMDPAFDELRGFAAEMGPKVQLFAEEMGPAFADLMAQVDDFSYYEPPVLAPNGDIVIRRRPDAPPFVPDVDEDTGEVEL